MEHFKDDLDTLTSAVAQLRNSPTSPFLSFAPGAISLLRFHWPGNLRHCIPDRSGTDTAHWTDHDRLLDAIAEGDGEASQRVAEAMCSILLATGAIATTTKMPFDCGPDNPTPDQSLKSGANRRMARWRLPAWRCPTRGH